MELPSAYSPQATIRIWTPEGQVCRRFVFPLIPLVAAWGIAAAAAGVRADTPAPSETPAPASAEWVSIRGDAEMHGVSPTKLRLPLTLAWSAAVGDKQHKDGVVATPIVYGGKVYIGAQNGRFACLDLATGKEIWHVDKKGFFESTAGIASAKPSPTAPGRHQPPPEASAPKVGGPKTANQGAFPGGKKGSFEGTAGLADGLVIAGCGDAFIYAWKADTGEEVWKFETEGEVHAGVSIWTDAEGHQRVLIGSYDNFLYCLDAATGKKLWTFETANYVNGATAIYKNQAVFGGCDGMLYVIDCASGQEKKKIEVGSYIGNNIAAYKDVAYVAHYGNHVEAFSIETSARLWDFADREFPYYAAPAVNDQWVIVGSRDKRVRCLSRDKGVMKWQFRARGDVDSSPVICGDEHVIFGSNDGSFYAAKLADGTEAWHYEIGAPIKSAPAVAGDFILIGADDGGVYCFKNSPAAAH